MKKSAQVTLTLVATLGVAACNRQRQDPCVSASFSEQACQDAVRNHGYFWHGTWVPMTYGYPYPYYYDAYRSYAGAGGSVRPAPAGSYSAAPITRGGFGSIGAGHSAGE